jgi:hypothetical protein
MLKTLKRPTNISIILVTVGVIISQLNASVIFNIDQITERSILQAVCNMISLFAILSARPKKKKEESLTNNDPYYNPTNPEWGCQGAPTGHAPFIQNDVPPTIIPAPPISTQLPVQVNLSDSKSNTNVIQV